MFSLPTLREFIDNPMGKGSTAIPNRQLIKDDLIRRYNELIKKKKIEFTVYRDKDEYYFHFLIPSESERENTYDVVLHFTQGEENFKFDNFLNRYYVKFFSNCPSFIYTYAFAFNMYGWFIEDFSGKYHDEVLEQDPITRNPGEIVSYEKSIFFACHHLMQNNKYLNKMILNPICKPYDPKVLYDKIRTDDKIKIEIDREKRRVEKVKKEEELKKTEDKSSQKGVRGITDKDKIKRFSTTSAGPSGSSIRRITPKAKIKPQKPRPKIKPK